MTYLDIIRALHVAAWTLVGLYTSRGAGRVMRGNPCSNDHFTACFFFISVFMVIAASRWWITVDEVSFAMIYAVSALLAFHVFRVSRAHGRGRCE